MSKSIQWKQRIALTRHSLHSASRSGDFTFFKALQAQAFIEGTNHVATLSAAIGDEADALLAALDAENCCLAQVFQDAFKTVHDNLKTHIAEQGSSDMLELKSKLNVDAILQKQMADMAIDKLTTSTVTLIHQQPAAIQESLTNVWITGVILVADSIQVCLAQIDSLEHNLDDFIRLEDSWNTVKASVSCSIAALRGIFNLMADDDNTTNNTAEPSSPSRSASIAAASGAVFRRLSNAFSSPVAPSPSSHSSHSSSSRASSRANSVAGPSATSCVTTTARPRSDAVSVVEYRAVNYRRSPSVSSVSGEATRERELLFQHTELSPVPPTPAAFDAEINPFACMDVPPGPAVPEDQRGAQKFMVHV